jgi:protein TonB
MFEDSLLDSSRFRSKRKAGATVFSFVIQIALVCVLILIPLIYTEALPAQQFMTMLVAPPPPPPPPPPPAAAAPVKVVKAASEMVNGSLRTPTKIPQKIQMLKEDEPMVAGAGGGVVGGVPGGVPGGTLGGVLGGIINSTPAAVPKIAQPVARAPLKVSQGVTEGLLVNKVQPVYPPLARQARVQGEVVLQAIISKNGSIENLKLISGNPLLTAAAIDAVKQWKYKPYFLNGEPVEVDTMITVRFNLSGGA